MVVEPKIIQYYQGKKGFNNLPGLFYYLSKVKSCNFAGKTVRLFYRFPL